MNNLKAQISEKPVPRLDPKRDFVPPKPSAWNILKRRIAGLFGMSTVDKDVMIKR